ncbi:MAG: Ribosomal RNA small subunit methyltransferase H [Owenweeksia sp. TMED14]|nr:MAG: Ribosomal RNA small subunit methyltransferase H [Owenweeksia sp. TMED14]|tara:strand:+ start:1738 stop:2643 length:906 start_codon:yes stop_codon:yes gene_type:complete
MTYHNPVLLEKSIELLAIKPDGIYVDATFGGGGHSKSILEKLNSEGRLFGFDQDPDAEKNKLDDERFILIPHNFEHLRRFLKLHNVKKIDGILADLGVSSHQFDVMDRGFSIRGDGPLDMRMNPRTGHSAAEWLSAIDEYSLTHALATYGEVSRPKKLAQVILNAQESSPILTTRELLNVIEPHGRRGEKVFAKVFQAIRICVNRELEVLEKLLEEGRELLLTGGRFVMISYHSLEDRRVKVYFREGQLIGEAPRDEFGNRLTPFKLITRKAIIPEENEILKNPRSRSAKLRAAEKTEITK